MAKKDQKSKPKFSSFAAKNKFTFSTKDDASAERSPGLERHNQEKTALLDNPGPFMETMSGNNGDKNVALVDLPAKEINDGYKEYGFNEYPVSGDDFAKMGNNRVRSAFAKPILQHYTDVPEDKEHYVTPRDEKMHTPPDRGSDPSRRPDMGMSGPEQRARYA